MADLEKIITSGSNPTSAPDGGEIINRNFDKLNIEIDILDSSVGTLLDLDEKIPEKIEIKDNEILIYNSEGLLLMSANLNSLVINGGNF